MVGKHKQLRSAVVNILATGKSFGNICFFDQHYQPGKMTSQVSALMIEYLVAFEYLLVIFEFLMSFKL